MALCSHLAAACGGSRVPLDDGSPVSVAAKRALLASRRRRGSSYAAGSAQHDSGRLIPLLCSGPRAAQEPFPSF